MKLKTILNEVDFSDLDDFDSVPVKPSGKQKSPITHPLGAVPPKIDSAGLPCPKCRGKGHVIMGYNNPRQFPCYNCKGSGEVHPKHEARRAAAKKGMETRTANLASKRDTWVKEHPEAAAWIEANAGKSNFGASMASSLRDYGSLTDGQLNAIMRGLERDKTFHADRIAKAEAGKSDLGQGALTIISTLNRAVERGVSRPKLRTGNLDFSLAGPSSKNAGYSYITSEGEYVGKINPAGMFYPAANCTNEMKIKVQEVALDPLKAAVEYGRRTGQCSCCGRRLDNKESIDLGIGPICRSKFF